MPADPDPIGTDLGRARRTRKLRAEAACVLCGYSELEALRRVKRSLLEDHHLAGRTNDDTLVVSLCLNCHRLQTVRQRGVGVELDELRQRTDVERLVSLLRGLGLFFDSLAQSCVDWADRLVAHVARLDAGSPEWRHSEPRIP